MINSALRVICIDVNLINDLSSRGVGKIYCSTVSTDCSFYIINEQEIDTPKIGHERYFHLLSGKQNFKITTYHTTSDSGTHLKISKFLSN